MNCECRIPKYHGDDDWVEVTNTHGLRHAVELFTDRMNRKDFELWLVEDAPREVWARKLGQTEHVVYNVSFRTVKQFICEEADEMALG